MPEYTFQLRGWYATVAIVALLAYAGGTVLVRVRPVDDAMQSAVREQLLNDYSGRGPKDLARLVTEAREGLPIEPVPERVQRDVQFTSLAAHGRISGQVAYIRAQVTVDGGPPPDGRSIRYFCLSPKFGGGWMVVGESTSFRYYRELLP